MSDLKQAAYAPAETDLNKPVREFGLWSAFTLGFSNISPILGIYSVFAISLAAAGPGFLWSLPLVLGGQLLVACVFSELVSRWPFQGSVYAWSCRLVGPRYGWFANWAYIWGMVLSLAFLALASSGYLLSAIGITAPPEILSIGVGLLILALGSCANMLAGPVLKILLTLTLCCELTASAGIGTVLLLFHHINPVSILFSMPAPRTAPLVDGCWSISRRSSPSPGIRSAVSRWRAPSRKRSWRRGGLSPRR